MRSIKSIPRPQQLSLKQYFQTLAEGRIIGINRFPGIVEAQPDYDDDEDLGWVRSSDNYVAIADIIPTQAWVVSQTLCYEVENWAELWKEEPLPHITAVPDNSGNWTYYMTDGHHRLIISHLLGHFHLLCTIRYMDPVLLRMMPLVSNG